MHEWQTARLVAQRVQTVAPPASRVSRITLRLGTSSHLTADALRQNVSTLLDGTNASAAEIIVDEAEGSDVVVASIDVEA